MAKPTIIMAAPNGARKVKTDHPAMPITIMETIAAAKECHAAGASILHAHVRDDDGKHLLDSGRYQTLLDGLRTEVPNMLVQITTEAVGIYTPKQQSDLVFDLRPDFGLGFREMTVIIAAARDHAAHFYRDSLDSQIHVQHILYDLDDLARFREAMADGILPAARPHVLPTLSAVAISNLIRRNAAAIADGLSDMASWSICAFGYREFDVMIEAIKNGGNCRLI